MYSYWEKKHFFFHRDLIVCGAGFTGLSAAIYYKRKFPKRKVAVMEKDAINGGASTRNAGFACFGSPSEILADLKKSGESEVFRLVEKRWRGLQNLRQLLGDSNIAFEQKGGYELFRKEDPLFENCHTALPYLNQAIKQFTGKDVYRLNDACLSKFGFNGIEHIIENAEEGQVDTGKMYKSLFQLARESGVEIFNGISIEGFEEHQVVEIHTNQGAVTADHFLIANNGFAEQLLPGIHTTPARAQVLITSPIHGLKVDGTFHMDEGFYYFRDVDGRVLFGGGRNTDVATETTTALQLNKQIQTHLEKILRDIILPGVDFQIDMRWAGIMGMGAGKQVITKQLSRGTFCAVRLSGMGLALSTLLGKEIVEMME